MQMGSCYNVVPGDYQENLVGQIAPGKYIAEWIDPATGKVIRAEKFIHAGGNRTFVTPWYIVDIALRIKAFL
jgi:hypothetical protein